MSAPSLPHFPDSAGYLLGLACRGTFEAHLTVRAAPSEQQRFVDVCADLGVKAILIELARGEHASQPMTSSLHRGELGGVLEEIQRLGARLMGAGFPITRVKIEALASDAGVPADNKALGEFPDSCYFEFHVKLLLPGDAELTGLDALCERHDARLSRSARRQLENGMAERFVTQRVYRAGRAEAFANFDRLTADLDGAGYRIIGEQREYTIYDSAAGLDSGWLDPPEEDA